MQTNEVIARLEKLVTDGTVTTTVYRLGGEWQSILVNITNYNTGKNIVVVIDNKGTDHISRQIARLEAALHPERVNHFWEITGAPNQLPALPMEIAI